MKTQHRKIMLDSLNGCEVRTCLYETWNGIIMVDGEKIIADGKVIDEKISDENLDKLWDDFIYCEGEGYYESNELSRGH